MAVKRVPVFETSDGKTFGEELAAERHEAEITLRRIIRKSAIGRGGDWSPDMIVDSLIEHARDLHPALFVLGINKQA